MSKYRIVQVKPLGLEGAFIIEQLVITPATRAFNEEYRPLQKYYDNISALNIANIPKDYYVDVPEKQEWKTINSGPWDTLKQAEESLNRLRERNNLMEESKTFKRVVVQEYD